MSSESRTIKVNGGVVDKGNNPISNAFVFTSDKMGNPMSDSKNTNTNNEGNFFIEVPTTDYPYLTISADGVKKTIIPTPSVTVQLNIGDGTTNSIKEEPIANEDKTLVTSGDNSWMKPIMILGVVALIGFSAWYFLSDHKQSIVNPQVKA